jgi:hypothetical protein
MAKKPEGKGGMASIAYEGPNFKTPQELVHIKHKISLLQYKYWILMLKAYRENYEAGTAKDEDYTFLPMSAVTEALGYQPKTREVESDLEKIRLEPLHFNILEKDGQKARQGNGFISGWHVSSNRIGVVFPKALKEAVENLDRKNSIFHLLNWNIFNSFSGKAEAVLYKLCKDYVGVGRTKEMSLEIFREYMGIAPHEYTEFKRLNQWCISGPIKKINESELSDIKITPIFTRQNRRVVKIQFEVEPKRQSMFDFGDDPAFLFSKISIPLRQQRKYLTLADNESIQMSIQRANEWGEEKEKKGETVDYGKVYYTAISENWGASLKAKLESDKAKQKSAASRKEAEIAAADQERLHKEFEKDRQARGNALINVLSEEKLRQHFESWKQQNKIAPGLAKVTSVTFRAWLRGQLLEKSANEEFLEWMELRAGGR